MRFVPRPTPTINANGGSTSMRAVLGTGPRGLPGTGSAAWTATTAVTTGDVYQAPDGSWIKSTATRTTRASFDATEATFWTAVLADETTVEGAALLASYATVVGIQTFAEDGEDLGGADDGDNAVIFQRAVDALNLAYEDDGKPRIIYVPDGDYYLAAALEWKNGVGLRGQSQDGTILWAPPGDSCINSNGTPVDQRTDCTFETFTIDGTRQTWASYFVGLKGMQFEYPKRVTVKYVTIRNTWATALALDDPVEVVVDHVRLVNFGRLIDVLDRDPEQTSGCSGIGNGVGEYDEEAITIIAPYIDGGTSGLNGLFFERPTYDAIENGGKEGRGISVRGGIVMNCHVGYRESGAIGADVDGLILINNRCNGLRIDSTNLTYRGGERGTYRGTIKGNGDPTYERSAGVWIGAGGDHFTIDGDISDNIGPGVATAPSALMGGSTLGPGVQVRANVHHNSGPGVLIQSPGNGPSGEVVGFTVTGDVYSNGTDDEDEYRAGVVATTSTDRLTLRGWIGDDQTEPTQQVGLALLGESNTASRINVTADLSGNAASFDVEQTVVGYLAPRGTMLTTVSNLRATNVLSSTGGKVTLRWSPPFEFTGTAITDYEIEHREVGDVSWTSFAHSASTDTTIEVSGLTNRVAHEFRVAAIIDGGAPDTPSTAVIATPSTIASLSDTFLRDVTASGLGSTDGGSEAPEAWTYADLKIGTFGPTGPNTWGIHTNPQAPPIVQARSNTATAINRAPCAAVVDVGTAQGVHEVTLAAFQAPSHPVVGLFFRFVDYQNYWFASVRRWGSATAEYALSRVTAGGNPLNAITTSVVPQKGDTIQVRDYGTSIELWVNGVLLGSYSGGSVANHATATKAGIGANFGTDSVSGYTHWSYATT